jgi:hypothetical protein
VGFRQYDGAFLGEASLRVSVSDGEEDVSVTDRSVNPITDTSKVPEGVTVVRTVEEAKKVLAILSTLKGQLPDSCPRLSSLFD